MRSWRVIPLSLLVMVCSIPVSAGQDNRIRLAEGWTLQSSAVVKSRGEVVSGPGLDPKGWHRITVPNTVVGALVENGHFPDPYFGMNLRKIPGTTYPIGQRFTLLPKPLHAILVVSP